MLPVVGPPAAEGEGAAEAGGVCGTAPVWIAPATAVPAGGVVGAALVAGAAGFGDALTIDIGGTSADAGLVIGGEPLVEPHFTAATLTWCVLVSKNRPLCGGLKRGS